MEIETEDSLLQKCRTLIEERLGWGSSDTWATQDYELLSQKIQDATNVSLSVATLKRIWGKIRYDSKPTATTLNTLAQYLGFENWRAFKQGQSVNGNGQVSTTNEQFAGRQRVRFRTARKNYVLLIGVITIALAAGVAYTAIRPAHSVIDSTRFVFNSKKVVDAGVPNSVIFDYDASAASAKDSVFIQQSWDRRLRQQVAYDQKQHTSIYYYPGYFQAKLVINVKVVKEHDLYIKTYGWLPLIEQKPVPVYFKESDVKKSGYMHLPLETFREYNVPLQPLTPWVAYYNVRDFGDLSSDDLIFETEVRNDYKEGSAACQHTEVHLLFEGGALVIPLSIAGCVSELNFMGKDGKKADLSVLGCDFSRWVNITCEFRNKALTILINRKVAFRLDLPPVPIRVVGIAYRFQGSGSVNFVKLSTTSGENLYEDRFGK